MRFLIAILVMFVACTSCNQDYRKPVPIAWIESSSDLSADSVWRMDFNTKSVFGQLNPGFTQNYWWLKARLYNSSASTKNYYLLLNNPHLNRVAFYFNFSSSKTWVLGDEFQFGKRPLRYRDFAVPISINARDSLNLLLKIDKRGESLQMNLQLIEQHFFVEEITKENLAIGVMLGWMLLITIFLLFLWMKLQDRSALFYAFYVICITMWMISNWGLGFQWIWPSQIGFASKARPFFITLSIVFFILSLLSFFPNHQKQWLVRKLLISVIGFSVVLILILLQSENTEFSIFWKQVFLMLDVLIVALCLLLSAWYILLNLRNKLGDFRYYGLGLIFLVLSSTSLIVLQFGANLPLQNLINTYGTGISFIGETTIIAFGFTKKFDQYKKEKERLSNELLFQQKMLAENLILAQEDERKRIGRDIHDSLGGLLAATYHGLEKIEQQFPSQLFNHLKKLILQSIREVRTVSHLLVPPNLAEFGLKNALMGQVELLSEDSSCKILFFYEVFTEMPLATQTVVYRISSELLGNALKHAEATEINLEVIEDASVLQIVVEDNGKGFSNSENKKGLGLKNIEYRVMYLKGTCNIDSNEEGTTIIVGIPING